MNRQEAIKDFLNSFRITLTNAFLYTKKHPFFKKSVEDLKNKIGSLFDFINPIKIGVTSFSLLVGGKTWDKIGVYDELAGILHRRKIKSIEIRKGITVDELIFLLDRASLAPKDIIKEGGIGRIFDSKEKIHFSVEELDYSVLLGDEGKESKDVWSYLLNEAIEKQDLQKLSDLTDNFGSIVEKFKPRDLLEDEHLKKNIHNFLTYLKNNQKDKFNKCVKTMFKSMLKYKDIYQREKIDDMKIFFADLNEDDFAQILLDGLKTDDSFDNLSLKLFLLLTDEKKHQKIASSLQEKVEKQELLRENLKARKNIEKLFSTYDSSSVSETYQNIVSSLFKRISFEEGLSFEENAAHINYRSLLVNLLAAEKNKETLKLVIDSIVKEWNVIIAQGDLDFLEHLLDIKEKKVKQDSTLVDIFAELERNISNFVETQALEEEPDSRIMYFIDKISLSTQDCDFYLKKLFDENKINPYVLKIFFKFFIIDIPLFYKRLEDRKHDLDFLLRIIENLKQVDSASSLLMLKHIFSFANNYIKIKILRTMQELPGLDIEFPLSLLGSSDISLKREALIVLTKDEEAKKEAVKSLFSKVSPFGRKNKIIFENLMLIEELDLREAKGYLEELSKIKFFWNWKIKRKAREILNKWHG